MQPARADVRLTVMTAVHRLAMTLAVAAIATALASGCTAPSHARPAATTGPAAATANFSAMGVAFRYPAAWRSRTWSDDVSSFTGSIVYLSTLRQHDPCSVTTSPGRITTVCGDPVGKLPPGGVLVRWNADGFPNWNMPEANTAIGGRPATETRTSGGWCATLGGTETITIIIPRASDNWYQMDACLRGPDLAHDEAQISAMLGSVRIAKGLTDEYCVTILNPRKRVRRPATSPRLRYIRSPDAVS